MNQRKTALTFLLLGSMLLLASCITRDEATALLVRFGVVAPPPVAPPTGALDTRAPDAPLVAADQEGVSSANHEAAREATTAAEAPAAVIPVPPAIFDPRSFRLKLEPVAGGLEQPVFVTDAKDDSGRLFVLEKVGAIRIVEGGIVLPTPFLDLRGRVVHGDLEQGLVSLAFHPRYRENGRFFVIYSGPDGDNTVAEYRVSRDPNRAVPSPTNTLFSVPHHFAGYHNFDSLAFGPDGYLYIGTGDGGGHGDPQRNAQNLGSLYGKILRLDVDRGAPYRIPPDNPFVGRSGARPEIWAYGFRNPWRISFDRVTGDLWTTDVGQNTREEINIQRAGDRGGDNYGWPIMEGILCYEPSTGCVTNGLVRPVGGYNHGEDGCAVIGGYRYRGARFPLMKGAFYYGDYCNQGIRALYQNQDGDWQSALLLNGTLRLSSFGEDADGELYAADLTDGGIYHLTAAVG